MAIVCFVTYIGGIKRIGEVTEKLVPVMAMIYIVSSLVLIFIHIGNFPEIIRQIVVGAFNPSAIVGGALGIGIIEAMKLMNEINSEMDGEIAEICVGNGQVVEYDQPLFRII